MSLELISTRLRRAFEARLPSDHMPVFVLGHQKAGTSAIAGLLGEVTALEVTIDLHREIQDLLIPRIAAGERPIENLIRRNRRDFAAPIIKHPNLTLIYEQLRDRFPRSRFAFVVRDPRDNIRSILDRLDVSGRSPHIAESDWERIPTAWQLILGARSGDENRPNHLDALADRWNAMARCFWDNVSSMELIRYEDFLTDKAGSIRDLAVRLGLDPIRDIESLVDHPFQPAGTHRGIGPPEFFGPDNLSRIESRCNELMTRFGYEVTA